MQEEVEEHIVALLQTRLELAQLVGSESYAHYRLKGCSLAETPEAVSAYLKRLQASTSSAAASEVRELEKFGLEYSTSFKRLTDWDRSVIQRGCLSASLHNAGLPVSMVQVCFLAAFGIARDVSLSNNVVLSAPPLKQKLHRLQVSVGSALRTLFKLVDTLLGVKFRQEPCAPGCAYPLVFSLHSVVIDSGNRQCTLMLMAEMRCAGSAMVLVCISVTFPSQDM